MKKKIGELIGKGIAVAVVLSVLAVFFAGALRLFVELWP